MTEEPTAWVSLRDALRWAQNGDCGLCCASLGRRRLNLDHVRPKHLGGLNVGNRLLVHAACNSRKGGRPPKLSELQFLWNVNERLRENQFTRHYLTGPVARRMTEYPESSHEDCPTYRLFMTRVKLKGRAILATHPQVDRAEG